MKALKYPIIVDKMKPLKWYPSIVFLQILVDFRNALSHTLHKGTNLVWPDDPQNDHPLEVIEFVLPGAR